jgi:hypothetical protein
MMRPDVMEDCYVDGMVETQGGRSGLDLLYLWRYRKSESGKENVKQMFTALMFPVSRIPGKT